MNINALHYMFEHHLLSINIFEKIEKLYKNTQIIKSIKSNGVHYYGMY